MSQKISDQQLRQIAQDALSLSDRIALLPKGWYWGQSSEKSKQRIDRWQQNAAGGDPQQFQRRVAWAGLHRNALHRLMSEEPVLKELPPWLKTFQKVIDSCGESFTAAYLSPESPVPFEAALVPFVEVAREQLYQQEDRWHSALFAPEIFPVLERQLLGWLAGLSGRAFQHQFTLFRSLQQPVLSRLLRHLKDYKSQDVYQSYIRSLLAEGKLIEFFVTYPVLARLMSTVIGFWVAATAEFLQRLSTDFPLLQEKFSPHLPLEKVVSLQPELGDPHNQGRSVLAVAFASGLRLVYKPRSLGSEVAYQTWLAWLHQSDTLLEMATPQVLDRGSHGWMSFIAPAPCNSRQEVADYYRRAGQLLGLMHILGGNDCHYENIIAMGAYPVLIDLETLLHHEFKEEIPQALRQGNEAIYLAQEKLRRSVVRVGLLPRWDVGKGDTAFDLSGLGSTSGQEVSVMIPTWQDINTDKMTLTQAPAHTQADANTPSLEGKPQPPTDFVAEIVTGFRNLYTFVMENKDRAPIEALRHQSVRSIYRATQTYASILDRALRPTPLQQGIDFSLELELLSRPLLWTEKKHPLWPLIEAEIRSLWHFDMPFFRANSSYTHLWEGDVPVSAPTLLQECFVMPSVAQVESLIAHLSPADLADQEEMIRASLYSTQLTSALIVAAQQWEVTTPATPETAVAGAIAIGADLAQRAIQGKDGSVSWIGLGYLPGADRFRLQPVEFALYDGAVGIALFLAALYRTTQQEQWRTLAMGSLLPLRHLLQNPFVVDIFVQQVGIGGAVGLGSLIYGMTRVAEFLQENSLLVDAQSCAALLTPDRIDGDRFYDIVAGAGGTILGLLALYKATGESSLLQKALHCGTHLLQHRQRVQGYHTWQTEGVPPLTGFSHGAAGIAYALLRLHQVSPRSEFYAAAQEAIAYEESLFVQEVGNWPDLRESENPGFMTSWCHGAPGIALARLGGLHLLDTIDIRSAIANGIDTTKNFGVQPIDHLCCGNCGRIETLLVAAQKLQKPDLLETARKQVSWLMKRATDRGGYYLFPHLPKEVYNPGFFQGVSGIGYSLLRVAYPDTLPSVLLWE